jgi:hypothetical protein
VTAKLMIELLPLWLALAGALGVAVRWALHLTRTIDQVRDVLMPPDGPSVRTTLSDHGSRLLVLEQRINPDAIPVIR